MGASVSWLSGMIFAKKEIRILILGLVSSRLDTSVDFEEWQGSREANISASLVG